MTIESFELMKKFINFKIRNFDYFYEFSDDHRVFLRNESELVKLKSEFKKLYSDLSEYEQDEVYKMIIDFYKHVSENSDDHVRKIYKGKLHKITDFDLENVENF